MFTTVILLILCAVMAALGVPLILKIVPPNPVYGVRTERTLDRPEVWFDVNKFGGWALVAAAGVTALALMVYSGTWLKSGWAQLAVFVIAIIAAVAATFFYERKTYGK
jgi:uncharacterized membrane protein